ncbi:winged helix-turn-helix transcriptional regulator [Rhodobacterales bacterium]|nr:winged helix-turn-helix transcriptional regulator [Rhodobacterales bacterium]
METASDGNQDPVERQEAEQAYILEEQIGYLLRKAYQRNAAIFGEQIPDLTPPQFALMARLSDLKSVSQNKLGRTVGLDVATTKGIVDRLSARGFLQARKDPDDKRRQQISLTPEGLAFFRKNAPLGIAVSTETLAPLTQSERRSLLRILKKMQ